MKVIKLDRRFGCYDAGYTHAVRFDEWGNSTRKFESVCQQLYGPAWANDSLWYAAFGRRPRRVAKSTTPYIIYFKNPAMITAAQLATPSSADN